MWRVEGRDLEPLGGAEDFSESFLEDWISRKTMVLGEELLVIGRQVEVEEIKDRLDILAIDSNLNTVAIEIKKGQVRGGVDIQSLKYASYISNWSFDQLREIAEGYFRDIGIDKTFANALQEFAEEGIDYEDVNGGQRIILVGDEFDPKIKSVAEWLSSQGVSMKLVKVSALKDGNSVYLRSDVILAPRGPMIQPSAGSGKPWIENGKDWHLNQRCNTQIALKLQELADFLSTLEGVSASWNQEFYVSFILAQRNWVTVRTYPNQLNIDVHVETGHFKTEEVAKALGIDEDKIDMEKRTTHDTITIKIGPDYDLRNESFARFIGQSKESFLKLV
jgi:hypothetical protein